MLTAKDFRTWWGSVLALRHLQAELGDETERPAARSIARAVGNTADELGHTEAVCRARYIHPGLIAAFESGRLRDLLCKAAKRNDGAGAELVADEKLFIGMLPTLETMASA